MNPLMEWITNLQLEQGHLLRPLIVGTLISLVCSVVGCFIVLRRMSFLADAIAHAMLAGVIGGYLIMKIVFGQEAHLVGMLGGAILAGIVTVAMIGFITRVSRIKQDTAIGIMYTGIFGLGALAVSIKSIGGYVHIDITHYIIGNVLAVSNQELWLLAVVSTIVLCSVILFFRPLQITSFDPVMAASIGIPVVAVDYLLTACTSLVVVSGVRVAGVILVVALIITPAASAYLLTDRLNRMVIISAAIGILGYWLGFFLTIVMGSSPGPTIVVTMTLIFLLVLVLAPRYGILADWIRQSSSVPQEVMEDVLGAILRASGNVVAINDIVSTVASPNIRVRRAIRLLARKHLLKCDGGSVALTESGEREATRLVRAHRLWETYLLQTGESSERIHEKAHQLEHISDQKTVDYLDDKLGHPITDPHGTVIPVDSDQSTGEQDVKASMLRRGNRARIQQILPAATDLGLTVGSEITALPRSDNGQTWNLANAQGEAIAINHQQADAIIVRLVPQTAGS